MTDRRPAKALRVTSNKVCTIRFLCHSRGHSILKIAKRKSHRFLNDSLVYGRHAEDPQDCPDGALWPGSAQLLGQQIVNGSDPVRSDEPFAFAGFDRSTSSTTFTSMRIRFIDI